MYNDIVEKPDVEENDIRVTFTIVYVYLYCKNTTTLRLYINTYLSDSR